MSFGLTRTIYSRPHGDFAMNLQAECKSFAVGACDEHLFDCGGVCATCYYCCI